MTWLITGANGLVASSLIRQCLSRNISVVGLSRGLQKNAYLGSYVYRSIDLEDNDALGTVFGQYQPKVVIHTAAHTQVDKCEQERIFAWTQNVEVTRSIAKCCVTHGAFLIYISTDYVFSGQVGNYDETAPLSPLGIYAKTKASGEWAVQVIMPESHYCIARIAVPFGLMPHAKTDFVRFVFEQLSMGNRIKIVTDQISNPTDIQELAQALVALGLKQQSGVYHCAGRTSLSRYAFAQLCAQVFQLNAQLIDPIVTQDLKQIAQRPMNASLNTEKIQNLGLMTHTLQENLQELYQKIKHSA